MLRQGCLQHMAVWSHTALCLAAFHHQHTQRGMCLRTIQSCDLNIVRSDILCYHDCLWSNNGSFPIVIAVGGGITHGVKRVPSYVIMLVLSKCSCVRHDHVQQS